VSSIIYAFVLRNSQIYNVGQTRNVQNVTAERQLAHRIAKMQVPVWKIEVQKQSVTKNIIRL